MINETWWGHHRPLAALPPAAPSLARNHYFQGKGPGEGTEVILQNFSLQMLKRTSSRAARLRQQAKRWVDIARLMRNRQQAKALRKQAEELSARAEEIEVPNAKTP